MRTVLVAIFVFVGVIAPAAESDGGGTRHALLIGISKYHPDRFADLPGAEPDVNEMARVLTAGGFDHANVTLMTTANAVTDPRKLPTSSMIRKQLRRLAKIRAAGDSIVIGLAGHGVQPSGETYYFCPQDADLNDVTSLISIDEIYDAIEASGAGFKLLLVDACRQDTDAGDASSNPIQSVTRSQRSADTILPMPPPRTAAFFSCLPGELAYERQDVLGTNGVFFHAIVRGLSGDAAGDDGTITLPDLERFVKKDVESFVRKTYSAAQHPVFRNRTVGLPVIVTCSASERQIAHARWLWERGRRDEAMVTVDELLVKRPHDAAAMAAKAYMIGDLAESPRNESKLDEAFVLASRSIELAPDSAAPYIARANVYRIRTRYADAIADCDRALRCDPNAVMAYIQRSAIHQKRNQSDAMLRDIERAIEIEPGNAGARAMHAALLFGLDRFDDAFATLEKGIAVSADVPMLHFMRGYGLDQQGRYDKAILAYTSALRLDDQDVDILCRRAISLVHAGDFPAAIEDTDAAIAINPDHPDIVAAKLFLFSKQGHFAEAVTLLDRAIAKDDSNAEWYRLRSMLMTRLGRHAEAQRDQTKHSVLISTSN